MKNTRVRLGQLGALCSAAILIASCSSSAKTSTATTTEAAAATTAAASATTTAATATTTGATTPATTASAATTPATTAAAATTPATTADALGKATPAAGTPVKIGYISSGVSAAIDGTEELAAAQATVKYVNDYLNGAGGHPIDLVACNTNEDAAIAADCGNQMVQKGVSAVLMNVNGQVGPWAKLVIAANIPIVAFTTADGSVLAPGVSAFNLANPIGGLASFPATIVANNKFTKASVITIDVPAAIGPVQALDPPAFAAAGVAKVDIVGISQGTADMGPQIQAELKNNPQLVHIIGNPAFCATVIKALRDASYAGTITMISNCLDDSTIKSVGADLKGIIVSYGAGEDPADPDVMTFKALVAKYAAGKVNPSGTPVGSFVVVMGFNRLMQSAAAGDLTPANVTAAIKAAPALPFPTIKGLTMHCDGKAVSIIPSACTAGFAFATLDASGKPTGFSGGGS